MRRGVLLVSVLACFALLVLVVWWRLPTFEEIVLSPPSMPNKGEEAPDFSLPLLDGSADVHLSQLTAEKAVMLYFWATWCSSCAEVKPQVEQLRRRIGPDRLTILAINIGSGDSLEKVRAFQRRYPLSVPVLYDTHGHVSARYGVRGIPLFVLIHRGGRIAYRGHEIPDGIEQLLF